MRTRITRWMVVGAVAASAVWAQEPRPAAPEAAWLLAQAGGPEEAAYRKATESLESGDFESALQGFRDVMQRRSARADAATYWTAYTQNKLGRRAEALAMLERLRSEFRQSRWLNDARALEVEIRQASGQAVAPAQADQDLKLMAINSLMHSDPDRAAPMLEKLLQGQQPAKVRERALFVLAQSGSPRARQVIGDVARGKSSPDLQRKALEYLGLFGGADSRKVLEEIYASSPDVEVKKRILHSYFLAGDRPRVLEAARNEKDATLRKAAIHNLGLMGAKAELAQIYGATTDPDSKRQVLHSLMLSGADEQMSELARNEKDMGLRREAVRHLGLMGKRTSATLLALYGGSDREVRKAVVEALWLQGNGAELVRLARQEGDPELKRSIIQRLSLMGSKEATDYMMEILSKE